MSQTTYTCFVNASYVYIYIYKYTQLHINKRAKGIVESLY